MKTRSMTVLTGPFNVTNAWKQAVGKVVARFTRGNIAAQYGRVIFAKEQAARRERAVLIAKKMSKRKRPS